MHDVDLADGDTGWSARAFLAALVAIIVLATSATLLVVGLADDGTPSTARHLVAPLDLDTVSDQIAGHYRFAAMHRTELEQIPCWCGCQQFLGHRNLADCFVRSDGRGWEAHAAGCGVCNGEAAIAERMLAAGDTPSDVKAAVDSQFGTTAITTPPSDK